MFWQESDLQTEPRYFTLTRTYELNDETAPLALVDLNPSFFNPIPSETSQLAILRSSAYLDKALVGINGKVTFRIERTEKLFALSVNGDTSQINRFSFTPSTVPSFSFICTETTELNCATATDNYLNLFTELRSKSTAAGLSNSLSLIELLLKAPDGISANQRERLVLQKASLNEAMKLATGGMTMIAEDKYFSGEQISTVDRSTYIFGLFIGLIVGCLILLQVVVSDGLIRSSKKLVSLFGRQHFLGSVDLKRESNSLQHIATSINGATAITPATTLRVFPVESSEKQFAFVDELAKTLNCTVSLTNPVISIKADELAPRSESPILILTTEHKSKISDIETAWTIATKSGNTVLGLILINQ